LNGILHTTLAQLHPQRLQHKGSGPLTPNPFTRNETGAEVTPAGETRNVLRHRNHSYRGAVTCSYTVSQTGWGTA
jgi:hypothetical protein